jgi:hypothetical protein
VTDWGILAMNAMCNSAGVNPIPPSIADARVIDAIFQVDA